MTFSTPKTDKPVTTLSRKLTQQVDVVSAYTELCASGSHVSGLLETASISTKEHTASVLMLSAAIRVRCFGMKVSLLALNFNGRQILPKLSAALSDCEVVISTHANSDDELVFDTSHEKLDAEIDEHNKLLAPSVFDVLRRIMQELRCDDYDDRTTQLVGTFSFDCYQLFERLPEPKTAQTFPDFDFYLADRLLVVDHQRHSARLVSKVFHGEKTDAVYFDYQQQLLTDESALNQLSVVTLKPVEAIPLDTCLSTAKVNIAADVYAEMVQHAKQHIIDGDVFQMVLARDFSLPCADAFVAYRYLRAANPSPYMFYLSTPEYQLFGASPESAVKYQADSRRISIYPIAGTRKRGLKADGSLDRDLDARIELELKGDVKEQAEHLMLVDLARNDVARVSEPGSRQIDRLLEVDRYSHVIHLVSKVSGTLASGLDALSAYQACMNMGTLTGAPKVKATQLLRQMEGQSRGVYGGAIGYLNAAGDFDTAIVIRSALVCEQTATVSAGAGIVYDSVAELEVKETENKAMAALQAIMRANLACRPESESIAEVEVN